MKAIRTNMKYEAPADMDILEAYMHKNSSYNRPDARRIKRALHKLALATH